MLGPPPFSSTRSLRRLRPQLVGFGLFNTGLVLFVAALLSAALALLVLSEELPQYVCSEDCNVMRVRATRDLIALRNAAAPYEDVALTAAIFGIVVSTAGTVRTLLRNRPGSSGLRAFGIFFASLATVIGFGHAAGFRRVVPHFELDRAIFELRLVGQLYDEAVAGLWLFLAVGVLALVAFAVSSMEGEQRTFGETFTP